MLNKMHQNSMERSNNFKHKGSNRSSPALTIQNGTNPYLNNNNHHHHRQTHIPTPIPPSSSIQCSAYFIARLDLNNYMLHTLQQAVDSVVSGPKPIGLKVKLSLPDEGLIVDNIPDPYQSWMYKPSELLYFWCDSYYVNLIVVITINRSYYPATGPYSASIFRLRGNESVQLFIQRAQQFFIQLSASNISKNNTKTLLKKSTTADNLIIDNNKKHHEKRSRHYSRPNGRSVTENFPSSQTTAVHLITRTEFDPAKTTVTDSILDPYNHRRHSETTVSSDSQTSNSKKRNNNHDDNDDDKMTTVSNYLPGEYVAELISELKELRNEIAALKLDARFTPIRSTSTSPLLVSQGNSNQRMNSSQSEIDAETQTDFNSTNDERQSSPKKNETKLNISNGISVPNKRTIDQSNPTVNQRTLLNGSQRTESDRAKPTLINSSHDSSSVPMDRESLLPIRTREVVSFRSSLENTIAPPENMYENVPILIQMKSNQDFLTNGNDQQKGKPYLFVTIPGDRDSELQKQYLSQVFRPKNGLSLLIAQESNLNKTNMSSTTQQITSNNQQYFQQALYSDHLTNPSFNVDKQLLANTIANQFDINLNSPYLQKLIANQHLFVTHKRTFANMVWQITPEEENALCSSPIATNIIDTNTVNSNSLTAKSILKPKTSARSVSKGQRISWDSTLE